MFPLAQRIRALSGLRASALAFVMGPLAACALPPLYLVPVLVIVFPVLIWRLDAARSPWRAAGLGWLFGFGYFLAMVYWVGNAIIVDVDSTWPLGPTLAAHAAGAFAVGGLAFLLALIPAIVFAGAKLLWRPGLSRVLVFAAAWTLGELLREVYLSGFPWAPIGMVWMPLDGAVQSVAYFGASGLSLITVLAFSLFALLGDAGAPARRLRVVIVAVAVVCVLEGAGQLRLYLNGGAGDWDEGGVWRRPAPSGAGGEPALVRARLVQPAIPQAEKWSANRRWENVRAHIMLSQLPGLEDVDAVIWGETAVSYPLNVAADVREMLRPAIPPGGVLITGSPRRSPEPEEDVSQIWNSLFVLDDAGAVLAVFDKAHLVPFGEYVPYRSLVVSALERFGVAAVSDALPNFSAGEGPQTIAVDGLAPFSPLICYEVVFPTHMTPAEGPRPKWLVNITNDGWYGRSTGPYQHFQIARVRAVEEGMSLVRVASTGISGVVSPLGRTSPTLELDRSGVLDLDVPPPLADSPPFARFGNAIPVTMALICMVFGLVLGWFRSGRYSH